MRQNNPTNSRQIVKEVPQLLQLRLTYPIVFVVDEPLGQGDFLVPDKARALVIRRTTGITACRDQKRGQKESLE